ncbi:hypothetical protein MUDAN_IGPPGNFN_03619 [Lactiplantibacillus mudanjiangensis]|nr:hypothetical protein MUDAN_IGPPGNFN_03619 [Lactiplantibacillus mudanjiangensis]
MSLSKHTLFEHVHDDHTDIQEVHAGDGIYFPSDHCLLYTSDAADEEDSVDLGGPRIIKKKKKNINTIFVTLTTISQCIEFKFRDTM